MYTQSTTPYLVHSGAAPVPTPRHLDVVDEVVDISNPRSNPSHAKRTGIYGHK